MRIFAIVLIALGVAALVYGGVKYTTREKIIDVGPIHASADVEKTQPIPPYVGAGAVGLGVLLLLVGGRGKKG
jgi:hypothetical protein